LVDQDEYSSADIRCSASGSPQPVIRWSRLDGRLSSDVIIREGHLRFNSLRKTDEGSYRCHAENDQGESEQIIQIYVRSRSVQPPPPQPQPPSEDVSISPSYFAGEPGDEIVLRCVSQPRGRVTWSKAGSVELPRNAYASGEELMIRYSTVEDSGRYICNVQFPSGTTRSSSADVSVSASSSDVSPKIVPLERKYSVVQGGDFEVTCEASGTPYPTVTWSIVSFN
jgi:Immunoglobulin domain